jgi:hypothetical protein
MKRFLTIFLMLAIWLPVHATTRYVSKAGSDSYTGASWSEAWLTIGKVNSSTVSGDTVVFGAGTWRDAQLVPVSGTSGDRTCYIDSAHFANLSNYPTSRVAWIYGADSLSGWTQVSGNVYRCTYAGVTTGALWQGNQLLWCQTSQANVNGAGDWWTDGTYVYAWAYGGGDPDNYDMEYPVRNPATLSDPSTNMGFDYYSLVGLGFKYGHNSIMQNQTGGANQCNYVCLDHCYLSNVAHEYGGNPSLLLTQSNQVNNAYNYGGRIRACSLGNVYSLGLGTLPQGPNTAHGNAVTLYSAWGWMIDSNVVFGVQSETPFYLKYGMTPDRGDSACELSYDTIAFNTISTVSGTPYGIRIFGAATHTAIYGNVITGAATGIGIGPSGLNGYGTEGYHAITNNTFYNCNVAIRQDNQEGASTPYEHPHLHSVAKYNVAYRSTGGNIVLLDDAASWDQIDSNMYYAATGTNTWTTPVGSARTWTQWQALSLDLRSINGTNPGFTDADNGNFARPGAGTNMNATYGGRTWMQYGAIQNSATSLPTGGISGAVLISGDVRYWIR